MPRTKKAEAETEADEQSEADALAEQKAAFLKAQTPNGGKAESSEAEAGSEEE